MDTIIDSISLNEISLNEIFQSDKLLIPHSDNNLSLFSSWDEKVENLCISKTIGSGATFSIWLHIFNLCLSTPKFVVFVAMKEYSTLLKTIIDDLEQVILGYKLSNSMPVISLIGKPSRPEGIRFPNGSEIKFLGLRSKKTLEKIEKESPQLFWLSDASELYDFDRWNPIHRILLSPNKQCQIILEAYPNSPQHWIYKLFHSDEPGILDLHEGRDIAINDTIEKCGSMMWLDFKLCDNPVMYQFHDERERKNIVIKLLEHIHINGSNNVESHIYAMCIVHDENFDGRSPLSLDKFTEIAMYVSKLANINIKHFLSESIATVFFRMHESNDGSSMTLRVAKRDDINTAEDALNATVVCNIMPFNQWVESVTNTFYDNEGIRIATEGANALECPTHARDAHFFLSEFVSHTQMELNGIRELSRRGEAITSIDMQYSRGEATTTDMQYALLFLPEKDGEPVEACSMSDIAENVDSIVCLQWD